MSEDGPTDRETRRLAVILAGIRTIKTLGLAAASVMGIYFLITVPILATAGRETSLRVVYDIVVNLKIYIVLPYIGMALTSWLWRRERRLRIRAVNRENRRNVKLELKIDPNRTSSGLNEIGETGEEGIDE